jgi:hypothetical protein
MEPRYPLDRRLGGPQNRSGRYIGEKILYPTGTRNSDPLVVQSVSSRYTNCAILWYILIVVFIRLRCFLCIFPSGFHSENLYPFLFPPMNSTCPTKVITLDLTVIIFGKKYTLTFLWMNTVKPFGFSNDSCVFWRVGTDFWKHCSDES